MAKNALTMAGHWPSAIPRTTWSTIGTRATVISPKATSPPRTPTVSTVAAPLYISEIAPPAYRGRLAGMFQFNIVFGILVAYLSNSLLDSIGPQAWRWMLGVEAVPALLYTLFCLGIPESPRWLIAHRGQRAEATEILAQVNVHFTPEEVDRLADQIAAAARSEQSAAQAFFSRRLKVPILLTVLVAFFNQMSGINVVLYFAPRIFGLAGLEAQAARLESVGLGVTNLIFTMIGLWMIDHFGRKTLLLVGSVGYIASLGICAWAFETGNYAAVPPALFAFIAAHAVGQGAVIWVFIAEIFPNQHRAKGQALGSFTHWVFAALLASAFPPVAAQFELQYVFGFFCGMMVLQLLWVVLLVPETKGVPLEEMQEKLGIS